MKFLLILLICIFSCIACNNETETPKTSTKKSVIDHYMKEVNKDVALEELEQIDLLLERYQWPVTETGTGIRYWIYEQGNGRKLSNGDRIQSEYTIHLINGNEVYNSDNNGLMDLDIGNSNVTPGMAEMVHLLHEGDGVKIIIPSHLGYGLAGDGQKIPSRATLIYDLKKIKIIR